VNKVVNMFGSLDIVS